MELIQMTCKSTIKIRRAQPTDRQAIIAIFNEAVASGIATDESMPITVAERADWFAQFDAATHFGSSRSTARSVDGVPSSTFTPTPPTPIRRRSPSTFIDRPTDTDLAGCY